MTTKLLYMDDFDVTASVGTVIDIKTTPDGRGAIILDQTCFYPRGGGQDWDMGEINDSEIEEVRLDENGAVWHIAASTDIKIGDTAHCSVDKTRRAINTRLHSAGHVIDMAVSALFPDWVPQKGAHYPHMSFVEYKADMSTETAQAAIQHSVDTILEQDINNTLRYVDKQELLQLCRHVPDNVPANKPTRVVLYGDFGVPCGGTHVKKLAEIGKIEVTKVKSKKGITKVSYRVEGIN